MKSQVPAQSLEAFIVQGRRRVRKVVRTFERRLVPGPGPDTVSRRIQLDDENGSVGPGHEIDDSRLPEA